MLPIVTLTGKKRSIKAHFESLLEVDQEYDTAFSYIAKSLTGLWVKDVKIVVWRVISREKKNQTPIFL